MSTRPSDYDFLQLVKYDENKSKVQDALRAHPDLANIKKSVCFNPLFCLFINFTFYCYCTTIFIVVLIVIMNVINSHNISGSSSNYHIMN